MKTTDPIACLIRTHRLGERELAMIDYLKPYFGDALFIVGDDRAEDFADAPVPVARLNDGVIRSWGMEPPHDWGWRCGDLFLAAAEQQIEGPRYFWMIEPDVHLGFLYAANFFARFAVMQKHFLAMRCRPARPRWRWTQTLQRTAPWLEPHACFFPITRSSRALIRATLAARKTIHQQFLRRKGTPNDEVLTASVAAQFFDYETLEDHFPQGTFVHETTPMQSLADKGADNRIYHPVFDAEAPVRPREIRAVRQLSDAA